MSIRDYEEKKIRHKILNKIKPIIKKGRSGHEKGKIFFDGKLVARVKIPNNHSRIMKSNKSKYIAFDLRLNNEEFNNLIECPLTGPQYYDRFKKSPN